MASRTHFGEAGAPDMRTFFKEVIQAFLATPESQALRIPCVTLSRAMWHAVETVECW